MSGKPIQRFTNLRHYIAAVAISADGRRLAAASRSDKASDGGGQSRPRGEPDRVIVWDVESGTVLREFSGGDVEQVDSLALADDGRQLITGSGQLIARHWDVDAGKLIHTLSTQPGVNWSTTVAISPDALWAAYACNIRAGSTGDSAIQVFDLTTGNRKFRLEGDQGTTRRLAFSRNSKRLASAGSDDNIRLWDLATGQEVLSRPGPHNIVDLVFDREGNRLSALGIDGTLRTWDSKP
jgi:WD40 repeat protein